MAVKNMGGKWKGGKFERNKGAEAVPADRPVVVTPYPTRKTVAEPVTYHPKTLSADDVAALSSSGPVSNKLLELHDARMRDGLEWNRRMSEFTERQKAIPFGKSKAEIKANRVKWDAVEREKNDYKQASQQQSTLRLKAIQKEEKRLRKQAAQIKRENRPQQLTLFPKR